MSSPSSRWFASAAAAIDPTAIDLAADSERITSSGVVITPTVRQGFLFEALGQVYWTATPREVRPVRAGTGLQSVDEAFGADDVE